MVIVLCSVLNPDWEDLGIRGLLSLPELQGQDKAGFYGHNEALFAYLSAIIGSVVGTGQKAGLRADIRHHTH